jgi:hypothetical protein
VHRAGAVDYPPVLVMADLTGYLRGAAVGHG